MVITGQISLVYWSGDCGYWRWSSPRLGRECSWSMVGCDHIHRQLQRQHEQIPNSQQRRCHAMVGGKLLMQLLGLTRWAGRSETSTRVCGMTHKTYDQGLPLPGPLAITRLTMTRLLISGILLPSRHQPIQVTRLHPHIWAIFDLDPRSPGPRPLPLSLPPCLPLAPPLPSA
jgi:hypothetical protein